MEKDKIPDTWEWTQKLGCPVALQDHEKRLLNNGVMSLAWDEINSRALPSSEVLETRLNILLYHLRNNVKNPSVEHLNNIKRLKAERSEQESEINSLTDDHERLRKSIKEKRLKLAEMRKKKNNCAKKSKILDAKCAEIKEDISGVNYLMSESNNSLPPKETVIDEEIMQQMVVAAGNISTREDKHEVYKKITENLGSTAVPVLSKWLLNKRTNDTEELKNSELLLQEKCKELEDEKKNEAMETKPDEAEKVDEKCEKMVESLETLNSQLNVSLAKLYGKNCLNMIQTLKNRQKIKEYENLATEAAEKICQLEDHEKIMEVLESSIEIKTLEKKQEILKHYINEFNNVNLEEEEARLSQLNNDIREAGEAEAHYIKEIEKSCAQVKSGCQFIFEIKDRSTQLLKDIVNLSSTFNNNTEWLNISLASEVDEFYKKFDINALNKILLSNLKCPYRHEIKCINNALMVIPKLTSITPINQAPLYTLIDCFKNLFINELLNQEKNLTPSEMEIRSSDSVNRHQSSLELEHKQDDTMATLVNAIAAIQNSQEGIKILDSLYHVWANQPMQSVVENLKITVDNVSLTEWIKRFTTLLHMIQRNK